MCIYSQNGLQTYDKCAMCHTMQLHPRNSFSRVTCGVKIINLLKKDSRLPALSHNSLIYENSMIRPCLKPSGSFFSISTSLRQWNLWSFYSQARGFWSLLNPSLRDYLSMRFWFLQRGLADSKQLMYAFKWYPILTVNTAKPVQKQSHICYSVPASYGRQLIIPILNLSTAYIHCR